MNGPRIGRRSAHHRQHVAGGRVEHHHRSPWRAGILQVPVQDVARAQLQPDVHGEVHVAVAGQDARDAPIAGLMAVAHLRCQFGVFVALQFAVGVVLHQRGIGGVKILARAEVANQVRGGRAEGIMAIVEARACLFQRDT